jgi:threonine dehydrogenase-like Zn-dependent dehydrogenase
MTSKLIGLRVKGGKCMRTMKAVRIHEHNGPLLIEEVPVPEPKSNEVLVRITICAIARADRLVLTGERARLAGVKWKFPHILGSSAAGVIEKVGRDVVGWDPGERIIPYPFTTCDKCEFCLSGRENYCQDFQAIGMESGLSGYMAEYVTIPASKVLRLPENVPFEQTPWLRAGSTSFGAFSRAGVKPGFTGVNYGCGINGATTIPFAHLFGASLVISVDLVPDRLEFARQIGTNETVNAEEKDPVEAVFGLTDGEGVDLAMEFVGKDSTIIQAIRSTRRCGTVLAIGLPKPPLVLNMMNRYVSDVVRKGITILGHRGSTKKALDTVIDLTSRGKLDFSKFPVHVFPLDQLEEAWQMAIDPATTGIVVVSL